MSCPAGLAINMARQPVRFDEFRAHSSWFDGRGVCFGVNTVNPFKSEDEFSLYFNFFPKHFCRSDPKAEFAIECPVNHEIFFCFGMFGDANHLVFFPFVVTISTGLNHRETLILRRLWHVHKMCGYCSGCVMLPLATECFVVDRIAIGYASKCCWRYA